MDKVIFKGCCMPQLRLSPMSISLCPSQTQGTPHKIKEHVQCSKMVKNVAVVMLVATMGLVGLSLSSPIWWVAAAVAAVVVYAVCKKTSLITGVVPLSAFTNPTLKEQRAKDVDHIFCSTYNFYNEQTFEGQEATSVILEAGTKVGNSSSKKAVPIRSVKVMAKQIKCLPAEKKEKVATAFFKKLCLSTELLPWALDFKNEFKELFPKSVYNGERKCSREATLGAIKGRDESSNLSCTAYCLEGPIVKSNSLKKGFDSYCSQLTTQDYTVSAEKVFTDLRETLSNKDSPVARHHVLKTEKVDSRLGDITNEFIIFLKQKYEKGKFKAEIDNGRSLKLLVWGGLSCAYGTPQRLENRHGDGKHDNGVTFSAMLSNNTSPSNYNGGGLGFFKQSAVEGPEPAIGRDGYIAMFPPNIGHFSDLTQLHSDEGLKEYEGKIEELRKAIKKGNRSLVKEKEGALRKMNAGFMSRIVSRHILFIYDSHTGKPVSGDERDAILKAFNTYWQEKITKGSDTSGS